MALDYSDIFHGVCVGTGTQTRTCQVGACSKRIPANLSLQGVCLSHYLEQAFTRVSRAVETCDRGESLDNLTAAWLKAQGDFAVQMLASGGMTQTSDERARLLDLLLCLANANELIREHSASKM
jgi:hypothetical protein